MQYDDLPGAASTNIEARIQELREDGVEKELAFPNAVLALFHYPDKKLARTRVPDLQRIHRRIAGAVRRPLLRRRVDQLVGPARRPAHAGRAEVLGLKTFLMPLNPGKDDDGNLDRLLEHGDDARSGTRSKPPAFRSPTTSGKPRRSAPASSTASSSA